MRIIRYTEHSSVGLIFANTTDDSFVADTLNILTHYLPSDYSIEVFGENNIPDAIETTDIPILALNPEVQPGREVISMFLQVYRPLLLMPGYEVSCLDVCYPHHWISAFLRDNGIFDTLEFSMIFLPSSSEPMLVSVGNSGSKTTDSLDGILEEY